VPPYWVVDAERKAVEEWTSAQGLPDLIRERLRWHPADASEEFSYTIAKLFQPVGASNISR